MISIALAFIYSAPKLPFPFFQKLNKIAFAKTAFLAIAWNYITTMLPIQFENTTWTIEMYSYTLSRFFYIYSICIIFDMRDREIDIKQGIKSLVTGLEIRGINVLFYLSLFVCFSSQLLFLYHNLQIKLIIAFITPIVVLGLLYSYSKKTTDDFWYYFVLDGMMMLSTLLLLVLGF